MRIIPSKLCLCDLCSQHHLGCSRAENTITRPQVEHLLSDAKDCYQSSASVCGDFGNTQKASGEGTENILIILPQENYINRGFGRGGWSGEPCRGQGFALPTSQQNTRVEQELMAHRQRLLLFNFGGRAVHWQSLHEDKDGTQRERFVSVLLPFHHSLDPQEAVEEHSTHAVWQLDSRRSTTNLVAHEQTQGCSVKIQIAV